MKFFKILGKLFAAFLALFGATFAIYWFNLDMKLTAAIEPLMQKHYDKIERDTHL